MLGIFPLLSCQKKKLKKPKENANHLYPHSVTYLSLETTGRGPIQVGSHQECILNFLTSSWKPRIRIFPDERFQFGKKKSWHLGWIWFLNIGFLFSSTVVFISKLSNVNFIYTSLLIQVYLRAAEKVEWMRVRFLWCFTFPSVSSGLVSSSRVLSLSLLSQRGATLLDFTFGHHSTLKNDGVSFRFYILLMLFIFVCAVLKCVLY